MSATLTALPLWADALAALLLVGAAFFALVGSFGLAKLGSFEKRLHGPTKAATLGVGGVLVASMIVSGVGAGTASGHELLITAFVFVTAPISAHLLVKAALHLAGRDARAPDRAPESSDRTT